MLSESITYLRTSEEWVKTVIIGGFLTFFGFLIVPAVLVVGYLLRVLRARMHGEDEPPVFDEWGELLRDGVYGTVIAIAYGLIPAVLAGVIFALVLGGASTGQDVGALFSGVVAIVGSLLLLVVGLAVAYVLPAALANYAETDRLGSAFAFGDLRTILTSGKYATAWLVGFAVVLVAGVVTGALNAIPILGTFLGAFVSFYAVVAAYYCIGTAWGELHAVEMREDSEMTGEQPAV